MTYLGSGILGAMKAAGKTESVTYRPQGGTAVAVEALVERPGRSETMGAGMPQMRVLVARDSTLGLTASSIKPNVDAFAVAEFLGGSAVDRYVQSVDDETADTLVVLVR